MLAERITAQRQARHEAAVLELQLALSSVRTTAEEAVVTAANPFRTAWSETLRAAEAAVSGLVGSSAAILRSLTWKELQARWAVPAASAHGLTELATTLQQALDVVLIRQHQRLAKTLKDGRAVLISVAYLLPAEVDRLLLREALQANQGILETRKACATAASQLAAYQLHFESFFSLQRTYSLSLWRAGLVEEVLADLQQQLTRVVVLDEPAGPTQVLQTRQQLQALYQHATTLLPPQSHTGVSSWRQALEDQLQALQVVVETCAADTTAALACCQQGAQAAVVASCQQLATKGSFSQLELDELVRTQFDPVTMAALAPVQDQAQALIVGLTSAAQQLQTQARFVLTTVSAAMTLWNDHHSQLEADREQLEASVESARQRQEQARGPLEAAVQQATETLRQASSAAELKLSLHGTRKKLALVEGIYRDTYRCQLTLCGPYLANLLRRTQAYDTTLRQRLEALPSDPAVATIVKEWLRHAQAWPALVTAGVEEYLASLKAELADERDVQLSLHAARLQRLEKNVHNLRASELAVHCKSMDDHTMRLEVAFGALDGRLASMTDTLVQQRAALQVQMLEWLTKWQTSSAPVSVLATGDKQMATVIEDFCGATRLRLASEREGVQATTCELRRANSEALASLLDFANGGNYSPAEVASYSEVIKALATRIDASESRLLGGLDATEAAELKLIQDIFAQSRKAAAAAGREAELVQTKATQLRALRLAIQSQTALLMRQAAAIQDLAAQPGSYDSTLTWALALASALEEHWAFLGDIWQPVSMEEGNDLKLATQVRPKAATSTSTTTARRPNGGRRDSNADSLLARSVSSGVAVSQALRSTSLPHDVAPWLKTLPVARDDQFWGPLARATLTIITELLKAAVPLYEGLRGRPPLLANLLEETLSRFLQHCQQELRSLLVQAAVVHRDACTQLQNSVHSAGQQLGQIAPRTLTKFLTGQEEKAQKGLSEKLQRLRDTCTDHLAAHGRLQRQLRPQLGHPGQRETLAHLTAAQSEIHKGLEDCLTDMAMLIATAEYDSSGTEQAFAELADIFSGVSQRFSALHAAQSLNNAADDPDVKQSASTATMVGISTRLLHDTSVRWTAVLVAAQHQLDKTQQTVQAAGRVWEGAVKDICALYG